MFPLESFSTVLVQLKKCKDSITKKEKKNSHPLFFIMGVSRALNKSRAVFLPSSFSLPPSRSFLPAEILQLQQQQSICDSATTSAGWLLPLHWLPYALTEVAKSEGASPLFFFFFFNWKDTNEYSLLVLYQRHEFYLKDWKGIAN